MNILAFDTALGACSVAVGIDAAGPLEQIEALYEDMSTGQAERLMPMIETAMRSAGLGFADLDRIAVTVGPGTFTGTRIAIAAARALALATGASVIGVSTLQLMAEEARRALRLKSGDGTLTVAVDAHRGQVYLQSFEAGEARALAPPQLLAIEEAAVAAHGEPITFVGSGAALVAEAAHAVGQRATPMLPNLQPNAAFLLVMAQQMQPGSEPVRPLYLRPADAKPQLGKSLARVGR